MFPVWLFQYTTGLSCRKKQNSKQGLWSLLLCSPLPSLVSGPKGTGHPGDQGRERPAGCSIASAAPLTAPARPGVNRDHQERSLNTHVSHLLIQPPCEIATHLCYRQGGDTHLRWGVPEVPVILYPGGWGGSPRSTEGKPSWKRRLKARSATRPWKWTEGSETSLGGKCLHMGRPGGSVGVKASRTARGFGVLVSSQEPGMVAAGWMSALGRPAPAGGHRQRGTPAPLTAPGAGR